MLAFVEAVSILLIFRLPRRGVEENGSDRESPAEQRWFSKAHEFPNEALKSFQTSLTPQYICERCLLGQLCQDEM